MLVYIAIDLPLPIVFISLNIVVFCKYGIFFPSIVNCGANNLYIFSCLVSGLYFIKGNSCVA